MFKFSNKGNPVRPDQNGMFDKVKTTYFEIAKGLFKGKSETIVLNDIDNEFLIPSVKAVEDYIKVIHGSGTPETFVTADVGTIYINTLGGALTTLYIKTSGTGNTGWTAK